MAFEEEYKNEAYQNSDIIIDSEDFLVVKPKSNTSVRYFGSNYIIKNYNKFRDGVLYFIINKTESKPIIYTLYKGDNESLFKYYNEYGKEITFNEIIEEFSSIESDIIDIIGVGDSYSILQEIASGVEMDKYKVRHMDDLIYDIRFNKNNPLKSMIVLRFDSDEDYFSLFDFDEDNISYMNSIFNSNSYNNYFNDYDRASSDWDEGYLLYDFSDENFNKLKSILKIVKPSLSNIIKDNSQDDMSAVSEVMSELFGREVSSMIDVYNDELSECKLNTEKETIKGDLCDIFKYNGIFNKGDGCFYTYVTTVNILLNLYKEQKDFSLSVRDLLSKIGHNMSVSDYYEYYYETDCYDYNSFKETFNREVTRQLDNILDNIDMEKYVGNDKEVFRKYEKYLIGVYGINKWFTLPHDKHNNRKKFRIDDYDINSNKINLTYRKEGNDEKRSYDIDGFIDFLNNPEIFEQKIIKYIKI